LKGTKENIHKGIYAKRKRNKVPESKKQSDLKHQHEEHHRKQTEEALEPREKGDQIYEDNRLKSSIQKDVRRRERKCWRTNTSK